MPEEGTIAQDRITTPIGAVWTGALVKNTPQLQTADESPSPASYTTSLSCAGELSLEPGHHPPKRAHLGRGDPAELASACRPYGNQCSHRRTLTRGAPSEEARNRGVRKESNEDHLHALGKSSCKTGPIFRETARNFTLKASILLSRGGSAYGFGRTSVPQAWRDETHLAIALPSLRAPRIAESSNVHSCPERRRFLQHVSTSRGCRNLGISSHRFLVGVRPNVRQSAKGGGTRPPVGPWVTPRAAPEGRLLRLDDN